MTTTQLTDEQQDQMDEFAAERSSEIINEVWDYRDTLSLNDLYEMAQEDAAKHPQWDTKELTELTFGYLQNT